MKRFVEGADRGQSTLLPECLDDFIDESNPVRVIDAFVDALDLAEMGFEGIDAAATGRPAYHPSVLLKLYICGYLNQVQSSRRLEREAGRNVEVMWLLGRLAPDHKTITDFRKDNGAGLRQVCARFVELCRGMDLLTTTSVAIDGSKFKAVNNRVLDAVQQRLDATPQAMRQRRETVEHPFGTIKARMGATYFLTKTLPKVVAEMALAVLAYNLTRVMNTVGTKRLIAAITA